MTDQAFADALAEACDRLTTASFRAQAHDRTLALYDAKQAECDRLREKLAQIVEDVDAVDGGIDLYLFYERMQANAVDARALLAPERSAEK